MDKFRLRTCLGKIKEMWVKMNKTEKSKRNDSCMSDFLSSPFSSNGRLVCWQQLWGKDITDIGQKKFFGK